MSKQRKKFVIVDGNALLHRAWHALPPMTTKDGRMVNAVYGFLTTLFKALTEFKPEYLAVTFDRKEKTFRHEISVEYKAQREKQPDEFYEQLPILKQVLEVLNIPIFEKAGFEADDVIGTLCHQKSVDNDEILSVIVTGDKDAFQLVDENTHVYTLRKGMNDTVIYDVKGVMEKYEGLTPEQLIDYKGLRGDPSDNIAGVPGVGEKTALGLIKEFGTMDELYKKVKVGVYKNIKVTERLYQLLVDNKEQAYQSRVLSTIVRDVPIDFSLEKCALQSYNKEDVYTLFQELEFKSLLNRLPALGGKTEVEAEAHTERQSNHNYTLIQSEVDFEKFFEKLQQQKSFVFDTETDGLDVITAKLLGISFCWEEGVAYYVEAKGEFLEKLKSIFADPTVKKAGQNMKFDIKALKCNGLEVEGIWFDTMIASYLLNPGTRAHNLDDMVFRELGYQMTKITDLIGKGKGQTTLAFVDKNKVSDYSCEDADYTFRLIKPLQKELKENELEKLFNEIEMPLIEVLVEMELTGIKIDEEQLVVLSKELSKQINSQFAFAT
ncbi:MAG: polymerase I protein [Parcubacteria group bacterium GW2011_GWC2_38_7]|nr:MAG: polymerase I protein [Parcubacteria group bacterium GW2011_GWC2_38_7]